MLKPVSVFMVVVAVFAVSVTTHVLPAGKCKDVTPAPVEFNTVKIRYRYWQLVYVPDDEAFADMDSEFREVFSTSPNMVTCFNWMKTKNNTESRYSFKLIYGNDLEAYEEDTDENSRVSQFKMIPIAMCDDGSLLYYRCSDNGSVNIDTRFIIIPKGQKFSAVEEEQLLKADKACNFKGAMRKLKNKHG